MPHRAFEEVVLPHLDAAFNYARWLTKSDADAEDVVQDAAVRALRFFSSLRNDDAHAWLLTIVRNTWYARYFMISVDPLDENTAFAEQQHADFPLLSDPTKKTADAYGVLGAMGMANRWTFYIGKDGTIQSIDKDVKPATSAEDMAAKLHELGVWMRAQ